MARPGRAPARRWLWGGLLALLVAAALALAWVGLRGHESPERTVARVRVLLNEGRTDLAIPALKALLDQQPDRGDARTLLGRALLDHGQAAAAEAELRRAQELQQPDAAVLPLLARALLAQGKVVVFLQSEWSRAPLSEPLADADLKASLAQALVQQGDPAAARALLDQVLRQVPQSAPAQLQQARLEMATGQLRHAQQRLDALLAAEPKQADAWLLLAEMAHQEHDDEQAITLYRRALSLRPGLVQAHATLIGLLIARRNGPAAQAQVQAMRKALPHHPYTVLLDAQVAYLNADLRRANDLFQSLLKLAPDDPGLLQPAGALALRLGALEQAERLLQRALAGSTQPGPLRLLLAQAQLRQGQPGRVLATLQPLVDAPKAEPEALVLAAQARLLDGDAAGADALFNRVVALNPKDPTVRTAQALSLHARGQTERALAELQAVADTDTGMVADLALVRLQAQAKHWEAALAAADGLARKQPKQPLPWLLRGQVLQAKGDLGSAREAYEQALQRSAQLPAAVAALARLDVEQGQTDAARRRYQALVDARPGDVAVRLAQADLWRRTGADRAEVAQLLADAAKRAPQDLGVVQAQIDHHLASRNPKAAAELAEAALSRWPDQPTLLARLGRARLASGDAAQAVTLYTRWLTLEPRALDAHQQLAEAQAAAGDLAAAQRSTERGLEAQPRALGLQRLAVRLALQAKNPARALAVARQVQAQRPQDAAGWQLEGEVALARRQWPEAVAALRQAVAKALPGTSPQRLHHALRQAGQAGEAAQLAETWVRQHPDDLLFLHYLGDQAQARGDWPEAQRQYQAVLARAPAHASALNNLAWVLLQQRSAQARPTAEQAVRAAPDDPAPLDTLAQVLAQADQLRPALDWSRRAVALDPADPQLRWTLAQLQLKAGDKREAKAELDRLAALGERFAQHAEVAAALAALR